MTFAVISFYTPIYKIGDHTKEVNTIYCKQHNYTYLSYSKNFYKSEQGSTFYLTIGKKMWIKKLSYLITQGSTIK